VSTKDFLLEIRPVPASTRPLVPIGFPVVTRPAKLETSAVPVIPSLSLRSNFAWVLAGNVVYAACQWGMIVALVKLGSILMVGQFSLGLAIATPVLMFTNLHLRAAQATDARRLYSFAEYLQLRSVMTMAAIAAIAGIAWFEHYERQTTIVILAVALAKGIETLSDIHYGLFQLNDRLDQTGISMMLRGALSVFALSAGLYLTRDVFWGCVGLALAWLAALLFFDIRRGRRFGGLSEEFLQVSRWTCWWRPECRAQGLRRQWDLMCLALPLGIVTTMASINLNMPRYFIEARMGEHQLGIFSALAYATVAMTLVSDSLGHCAIPRMSRLYADGQIAEFRSVLFQLAGIGCALGLAGLAVAQVMGSRLLVVFYSPEYAAGSRVFVVLMLATAIHCVAGMLTSGILSARWFMAQVPMFAVVVASTALACYWLVPTSGLMGGAVSTVIGAVIRLALAAMVVGYLLLVHAKNVTGHRSPQSRIDEWNPSV
jgi:O-antigen/teichoic acid export membrane protein